MYSLSQTKHGGRSGEFCLGPEQVFKFHIQLSDKQLGFLPSGAEIQSHRFTCDILETSDHNDNPKQR